MRLMGLVCIALASGCATVPGPANPKDPYQSFNRSVYKFNDTLDRAVLKPVAKGYQWGVPSFARTGIRNFFSNLNDITVTANDVLEGKLTQGGHDALRFTLNTTIGLLGFVDVATRAGFEKHEADFGLTLAKWGVGSGPYLVLPFLGPSTIRDTVGRVGDIPTSTFVIFNHVSGTHQVESFILNAVSQRASLLRDEEVLDEATLSDDRYNFIRDAWLQRRRNLIYDGNPPVDPEDQLDDDAAMAPAAPPTGSAAPAPAASPIPATSPPTK